MKRSGLNNNIRLIQMAALAIAAAIYLGIKAIPVGDKPAAVVEICYVERIVDGDTIKLSNGKKVRLIGIDTPESHYSDKLLKDAERTHKDIKTIQVLGRKASAFTKQVCGDKKVRLEFDVEKTDRYGRLLAYVYLEDGTFVNAKIVEEGYAQTMTIPPNVKYSEYFTKLQQNAVKERKGLWAITDKM